MAKYRCPDYPSPLAPPEDDITASEIIGCGVVFDGTPDAEGLVDCPRCGIWFKPAAEPETVVCV